MKVNILVILGIMLFTNFGMAEIIAEWNFDGITNTPSTINFYLNGNNSAKATLSFDGKMNHAKGKGVLSVNVLSASEKSAYDIQLMFKNSKTILLGKKYRLSFSVISTSPAEVTMNFIINETPFPQFSKPGSSTFTVGTKWSEISLDIESKMGTDGKTTAIPVFPLGKVPAGTTLSFANVKFELLEN